MHNPYFSLTLISILFMLALVAVLAFEIWMFVDAYKNPNLSSNERILWLVGMLLLHPVVAIIYYFAARKPKA